MTKLFLFLHNLFAYGFQSVDRYIRIAEHSFKVNEFWALVAINSFNADLGPGIEKPAELSDFEW